MGWQWVTDADGFQSRHRKQSDRDAFRAQVAAHLGQSGGCSSGRWDCNISGCKAVGDMANHSHRTTCHYCLAPKAGAAATAPLPSAPRKSKKQKKQQKKRVETGGASPAAVSAQNGAPMSPAPIAPSPGAAAGPPVGLATGNVEAPTGKTVSVTLADIVKQAAEPPTSPPALLPAADYLEEHLPKESGVAAELEAISRDRHTYFAASQTASEGSAAKAHLESMIADCDARASKLRKVGKGPACQRATLDHVRTCLLKAFHERDEKVALGKQRDEDRAAVVAQRLAAVRKEVDDLEAAYLELRTSRGLKWRAVNNRRAERDTEALRLLDDRIAALPAEVAAQPVATTGGDVSMQPWAAPKEHFTKVFAAEADFPELGTPSTAALAHMGRMWSGLTALGTADIVVTFEQLGANVECAKTLIGDPVWNRFFPDGEPVDASAVAPAQLIFFLRHLLLQQAEALTKATDAAAMLEAAQMRITTLGTAQSKRQRVG